MSTPEDWAAHLDPGDDTPSADGTPLAPEVTAALDRVGERLGTGEVWDEPPPGLRDRLLAEAAASAAAESAAAASAESAAADPSVEPRRVERPLPAEDRGLGAGSSILGREGDEATWPAPATVWDGQQGGPARRRARARWFATAAAGVAAAAAVFALVALPRLQGDDGVVYEIAGTPLAPQAQAEVRIEPRGSGVAVTLDVTGLDPAPDGEYYAGWLLADDGDVVGIGSFHLRESGQTVELGSGVDATRYSTFAVSLQREDEPPVPSDRLVLLGPVSPDGADGDG